jgi:hypothetical protein
MPYQINKKYIIMETGGEGIIFFTFVYEFAA